MTPEQELVQQIREFIRSDQPDVTPVIEDLADQYAEICNTVNARLARCAEFLEQGLRSEAVHEAEEQPHLLELIDVINFQEVSRWRNICTDMGLPVFAALDLDTIELLRKECSTEQSLSPLLKEYRRLVHDGDRDGCVRILRELRMRDSENPVWPENLGPLEEDQLPGLRIEVDDALEDGDFGRLRELYGDLTHPQRVTPAPEEMLEQIAGALSAVRRKEVAAETERLLQDLDEALANEKVGRAGELLTDWDELAADKQFEADASQDAFVARVRNWYDAEESRQEAERRFVSAVAGMWDAVRTAPLDAAELHECWQTLSATGRPVPDDLEAGVNDAFARIEARRRARRRRAVAFTFLVLALLAAAGVFAWKSHQQAVHRKSVIGRLTGMLGEERYEEINDYLAGIKEENPDFFNSAELRHFREQTSKALAARDEKRRLYAATVERLGEIREQGFDAPEETIRHLLAEARQYGEGEEAEKYVSTWESTWTAWVSRQVEAVNTEVRRFMAFLRQALEAKAAEPFATLAAEGEALVRCHEQRKEAEPLLTGASTDVVEQFTGLAGQIDAWEQDYQARCKAREETAARLATLRRDIRTVLPDLEGYAKLLQQFVAEFPDAVEAESFKRAIGQLDLYRQATGLKSFSILKLPPDGDDIAVLRQLIAPDSGLAGSVWAPDLNACLAYVDAVQTVRERLPTLALSKGESMSLQYVQYRPQGETVWRTLYCPDPLRSRVEKDARGNPYTVYWGEVFYYERDDQKPWLTHTSKIFPNKLNSTDYEVKIQHRASDNIVPHGRFLFKFVAEATEVRELDVHVLNGIEALLHSHEEIQLVPKAWLIKRLVHLLAEAFSQQLPEAVELIRLADRMKTDVPWMNPDHPDVVAAGEGIRDTLREFPDIPGTVTRARARRALLMKAVSRRLRSAGWVQMSEAGKAEPVFFVSDPVSVWTIVPGSATALPSFKVVGRRGPDGSFRFAESVQRDLFAGQVLFAPGDRRLESDLLRSMGFSGSTRPPQWPASWPVNSR